MIAEEGLSRGYAESGVGLCSIRDSRKRGLNIARLSRSTFRSGNSPIPVVRRSHIRERYDTALLDNLSFRMLY